MRTDDTLTFSSDDDPARTTAGSQTETEEVGAQQPHEHQQGMVFADRFEVVRQLGEGGMGQVFRVHDRQIEGREVALKILHPRFSSDPRFRGLFFQEVRAGQSFVSEHVVQVRDTGQMEDGRLFMTMDLVDGENLSALLKREHSLDARHALEITRQALLGLKSGHEKGFIHRDIKPSNLMLRARVPKTERNSFGVHVLILDFGLANLAKELKTGQVAGTPFYMSPEQVRDERLDARSDLFAVAVVLYEMISGSRPFQGKTLHEVTSSVIETDVAPMIASLEELSPAIQKILERALQKDREARFQSAGEFIEAIERSKAYRLPMRVAPWLLAVSVGGTVLAGAEALLLMQRESELSRLNGELSQQRNVISQKQQQIDERDQDRSKLESQHTATLAAKDELVTEKQGELNRAQVDYENIKSELETQLKGLGQKYTEAFADLEALRKKDQTSGTQAEDMQSQVNRLEALRQESEQRVTALANDFREQERELARLREENEKLRQRAEPEAQRATGFDILVRLIQEGRGIPAWQKYLDLEKETLGKDDSHGGDFVEALARAAHELALFDDPGAGEVSGEARHLTEAGRALVEAEKHLPTLEFAGGDWIGHHVSDQKPPDRLGAARAALDLLRGWVATRTGKVSGVHEAEAAELSALPPLAGPEVLLQHVTRYGCAHAAPALARTAEAFLAQLVAPDGRIDAKKLRAADTLDAWGELLGSGGLPADSEAGLKLLGLWMARGWYTRGEAHGARELQLRVLGSPETPREPADLWRSILSMQLALDRALQASPGQLPTHGIPGFFLYRRTENGTTHWFKESAKPEGQGWTIDKELLSLDPLKPSVRTPATVSHQGKLYDFGWVLDLTATGANVDARVWQISKEPLPPGLASVLDKKSLADFQAEEGAEGHVCLVLEEKGIRRWISPRLGLVREEEQDRFVKDLVYTNAKRN